MTCFSASEHTDTQTFSNSGKKSSPINIIGAGSIGHLWSSFLQRKNYSCKLYSHKPKATQKLSINSPIENFEVTQTYYSLGDWQPTQSILVCVKAHQLTELCQQLAKKQINNATILLMMNGMGLDEIVLKYFPRAQVVQAYLTHGVFLSQNTLHHTGKGITLLGNLSQNYEAEKFESLIKILNHALPEVAWSDSHHENLLIKLIINAVINPVTALKQIQNGQIINNNQLIPEAKTLLKELSPLIKKLLPKYKLSTIQEKIIQVAQNTANNFSSMSLDIKNRQPTEIDYINGYLVKLASRNQLSLPNNLKIINNIKRLSDENN